MTDAAGMHRLLQTLSQAERHTFIATLSPRSRSNLVAYIATMEHDLAKMKQAFHFDEFAGNTNRLMEKVSDDGSDDDSCSDAGSFLSDTGTEDPIFNHASIHAEDELLMLLKQKEQLQTRLANAQALSSQLATSLANAEGLVDSDADVLEEAASSASSDIETEVSDGRRFATDKPDSLRSLMRALQDASPEDRRKAVADISQERFLQLISNLPEECDEEDSSPGEPSIAGPQSQACDVDACSALCISEASKPSRPRNTKPLGQLQVDGEPQAHQNDVLLRLPPRSRAHTASSALATAWERCLGQSREGLQKGDGNLKDSGVDGEVISAWLGGEISSTMCCARILEATVRGHFCAAPAQREMSRTVELYARGEAGGCLGGCLGALVGGLAALALPEDAVAGQLMSEMLPHRVPPQQPGQAVTSAAKVLAADGFDVEAVNFEFRRQCLQAHPQRKLGGLSGFLQVHCDLEVLRQASHLVQSRRYLTSTADLPAHDGSKSAGAVAAKAAALAQAELQRTDSQAVEASTLLSPSELEAQNEQISRYLLDLSWQKDAMKAALEHLQNHEAYAVLGIAPDISDGDLTKAYKAAAMRLHPDKGGNAEQFKAARAAYERILELRQGVAQCSSGDAGDSGEAAHAAAPTAAPSGEDVAQEAAADFKQAEVHGKAADPQTPRQEEPRGDSPRSSASDKVQEDDGEASEASWQADASSLGGFDAEAVVKAIPVESVSRQAEHALDGAQMCMKVSRLASEATGTSRSWSQLLRCGTHLLDSAHCVTQAAQSVSRCAIGVPSDLVPLLEKIKTAEGMTRQAVSAARDLMQCTEIISERGLKATELSNRLLQQCKELASTLQSVAGADEMSSFACRTMAKTYEGLSSLARETADATAAAAVMVGDAQQNAQVLKDILDKLQCKAKGTQEKPKDEDKETPDADTSSDEETAETVEDRTSSNRRLLLKLNTEVLELQKEMRSLILSNPSLMPEVGVAQKERIFCLAAELVEQMKWKFTMLGLHGLNGPSTWEEAMQETILLLQAAANWDGLAAPALNARILRAAALVDANLLYKMLQDALQACEDVTPPGDTVKDQDESRNQYLEAVDLLCRHRTSEAAIAHA
ncbi:DNAJ1 [Symbiodinium pilosum]|uniref:DNAJ1 protein n=1 Tax=Symbiodinium pilosum TaxID=2952 RepID=A0A812MN40_SYMPI|nr:DNAJ1 [Symbiodinium pilosum]